MAFELSRPAFCHGWGPERCYHLSIVTPFPSRQPHGLEWVFGQDRPEDERIRPAEELAAALREDRPIRLEGAVVHGEIRLDGIAYSHRLVVHNTVFTGHVHLTEGRFAHTVDLSGCEFREGLNLFDTRIDGQLKLPRTVIRKGERRAVVHNFDQIEVRGRLDGTQLTSEIRLSFRQARLGEAGFDGIQVDGDLDFELAAIDGDFFCEAVEGRRPEVRGAVSFLGARIGGQVDFRGTRIAGRLNFTDAEVRGDLRCERSGERRAEVLDHVRLTGARIGGMVHFGGARIGGGDTGEARPDCRNAVWMQAAEIARGLHFAPDGHFPTEIHGDVFGVSARVSHQLSFDRAHVYGDIDLQRSTINGRLLCAYDADYYRVNPGAIGHDCPGRLAVEGCLLLSGAQIQELVLDGRLFDPSDPAPEACCSRRQERRTFFRRMLTGALEPAEDNARLKMDRTKLSKLQIEEKIPDRISADGLTFDELDLPGGSCKYSELPRRTHPFKRSTYLAVEAWLRNKGFEKEAERVYIDMCNRDLNAGESPRLGRWLRWLTLGVTIGYGVRPRRLLWLFLLSLTLSLWVFSHPAALVSYSERTALAPDPLPVQAQSFWVTLGVALRCHFPMLFFAGDPNYVPSPHSIPGLALTYAAYALIVSTLSWVMVPLFLAGVTGIVRQRQ